MTQATDAGFVVGKYYTVTNDESGSKVGSKVKFIKDDGSDIPMFKGIDIDGNKVSAFLLLRDIKLPKHDKVPK